MIQKQTNWKEVRLSTKEQAKDADHVLSTPQVVRQTLSQDRAPQLTSKRSPPFAPPQDRGRQE